METIKTAGDMSKEQTALERIKDEVARTYNYKVGVPYLRWHQMENQLIQNPLGVDNLLARMDEVAIRYARECSQAALEGVISPCVVSLDI